MDSIFDINLNRDMRDTLYNYHVKKDNLLLEDIYILKSIFDEQNIENIYTDEYEINKLAHKYEKIEKKNNKIILKNIIKNKEKHLLFSDNKNKIILSDCPKKTYQIVKMKENISLASNFMSDYNSDLLDVFKSLKNNHRIRIIVNGMDDVGGYMYSLNYSKPYIIINEKKNVYDASCLIHEISHAYQQEKSILKKPKYPNFCQEVYSNYTQLLFYKYLEDNDLYVDDVKKLKIKKLENLKIYLNRIKYGLERNNSNLIKENDYQYGYGIALALYYYNMYLNDPELANYSIDWFVKCSNFFNQDDVLNRFAIDKEKIITKETINNYLK